VPILVEGLRTRSSDRDERYDEPDERERVVRDEA
jgi:hypothetical protein